MEPKKKDPRSLRDDMADFGTLGVELVVSVLIGAGVGYWLDKRLGTFPWLTVVGFTIGAAAGFRAAYKVVVKSEWDKPDKD